MSTKKTAAVLSLAALLAFTAATSMIEAQEKNAPPPPAPKADRMSPEQWEEFSAMRYDHQLKTAPLRDQLWARQMEYEALAGNPNAKPAEIKAIIDDMVKLRAQLRTERTEFYNQNRSKGFRPGPGRGYGHPYGPGCEFGYGPGHWSDRDSWRGRGHRGQGRGGWGHHGGYWRD